MEQRPISPDDVFWQLASLNQRIARIEQLLELLPILLVCAGRSDSRVDRQRSEDHRRQHEDHSPPNQSSEAATRRVRRNSSHRDSD